MVRLKVKVSEGQFSNEYAVSGKMFDGTRFSMFVERDKVILLEKLRLFTNGLLEVGIGQCKDSLVLIKLPQPTFEYGRVITVKKDQLTYEKD